jgi:acyl phosphate:glycerol-3-phosphate acyltransferase
VLSLLVVIVIAYLLGSIPFGYLLVRFFHGSDVRTSGSGNIGATNVARTSPTLGVATLALDAMKGYLAVVAAILVSTREVYLWLGPRSEGNQWLPYPYLVYRLAVLAALFAILGHMFPSWLKFRGGKGVATALGAFLLLTPKAVLAMLAIFLLVFAVFRYVSLASIVAVAFFPCLAWLLYKPEVDGFSLVCMTIAALFIIAKHHENIRRLVAGSENRFALRRG